MARDHHILATQERIFRIAQRNGLTLKAISLDADIPYNTLRSYAGSGCATVEMPVSALRKLVGVVPDDLLSLLLPEGRLIVQVSAGVDHDEIAPVLHRYLNDKTAAHHPDSPGGRDIAPCEDATLRGHLAIVRAAA